MNLIGENNPFSNITYIDLGDASEALLENAKKQAFESAFESSKIPTLVKKHYNNMKKEGYSIYSAEQKNMFFAGSDKFFFLVHSLKPYTEMLTSTFALRSKDEVTTEGKELDRKYQGNFGEIERYFNNMTNDFRIAFWAESELDKGRQLPYPDYYRVESKENWKKLDEPLFKICHFVHGEDISAALHPNMNHASDGKKFYELAREAIGDFTKKYVEELRSLIAKPLAEISLSEELKDNSLAAKTVHQLNK